MPKIVYSINYILSELQSINKIQVELVLREDVRVGWSWFQIKTSHHNAIWYKFELHLKDIFMHYIHADWYSEKIIFPPNCKKQHEIYEFVWIIAKFITWYTSNRLNVIFPSWLPSWQRIRIHTKKFWIGYQQK